MVSRSIPARLDDFGTDTPSQLLESQKNCDAQWLLEIAREFSIQKAFGVRCSMYFVSQWLVTRECTCFF